MECLRAVVVTVSLMRLSRASLYSSTRCTLGFHVRFVLHSDFVIEACGSIRVLVLSFLADFETVTDRDAMKQSTFASFGDLPANVLYTQRH